MFRRDFRAEPVRRIVLMGESNAYGMNAGDPLNEWPQTLAFLIRRFQDGPLRIFNNAIPANVISPDAPGYERFQGHYGTSPSAIERFEKDMIAFEPDMAVYAYGLNDSRCGHPAESFLKAYEQIVSETRKQLRDVLIVLVGPYWNPQYNEEAWISGRFDGAKASFGKFNLGGDGLVLEYNERIAELAKRYDAVFVDVYHRTENATWLIGDDACHYTDIGQWLIGQTVFGTLAANCSFLSRKSIDDARSAGFAIPTTGGTNALPHIVQSWRSEDTWAK